MRSMYIYFVLFLATPLLQAQNPFTGGEGTEDNPYTIASAAHLAIMAQKINAGDTAYNNKFYKLVEDVDLTEYGRTFDGGKGWIPIGKNPNFFMGHFDGNGKTITGLYIKITESASEGIGFFGCLNSATVKNLNITDVNISAAARWTGGVSGVAMGSTINNCYVSGILYTVLYQIGGIVGEALNSTVADCYTQVSVIATSGAGSPYDGFSAGGIVGWLSAGSIVTNCYATGTVSGLCHVGGVVGEIQSGGSNSKVTNCAALNLSVSGIKDVGRVIGSNLYSSTVDNNVAFSNIIAGGNPFPEGENRNNGLSGEDISINQIMADGTLGNRFTNDHGWVTENNKLPSFHVASNFPAYFTVPDNTQTVLLSEIETQAFKSLEEKTAQLAFECIRGMENLDNENYKNCLLKALDQANSESKNPESLKLLNDFHVLNVTLSKVDALVYELILSSFSPDKNEKPNTIRSPGYGSPYVNQKLINNEIFLILEYSTDETYGYTESNPIMVGGAKENEGVQNEIRFLKALTGPLGFPVIYKRLGSCCPFQTENTKIDEDGIGRGLLDVYEVIHDSMNEPVKLYINMYDSDILKVPVGGFTLKNELKSFIE